MVKILKTIPYIDGNAIVFVCDQKYFDFTAISIQSLLNNIKLPVCIHVLTDEVEHQTMEDEFKKCLNVPDKSSLRVYCINEFIDFGNMHLQGSGYISKAMYYRLTIPELMKNYVRVLYLDSDICVTHSLDELFEIPFENEEIIAGCNEPLFMALLAKQNRSIALEAKGTSKEIVEKLMKDYGTIVNWYNKEMKIDANTECNYMNSGVCLFDIKKCNDFKFTEKVFNLVLEQYKKNSWIRCPDQDVINSICQGRIKWLPSKWNALWTLAFAYYVEFLCRCRKRLKEGREYKESIKDAYIWHYVSAIKPWNKPHKAYDMAMHWWRVCAQTKFFEKHLHMLSPTVQRGILNRLDALQNSATINDFIDATDA